MSSMNLNTENLGALGGGTLIFAGFLVLAMVAACRVYDGLGSVSSFRKAAKQVAASVTVNAILYIVIGIGALSSFDRGPSRDGIQIFIILVLGLVVTQILFLAAAVRNLFDSLDQAR